jgi:hypothetical protein
MPSSLEGVCIKPDENYKKKNNNFDTFFGGHFRPNWPQIEPIAPSQIPAGIVATDG